MKVLVLNSILFTASDGLIPKVDTIKDTMIYGMCLGLKKIGHEVTLAAAEEYKPIKSENYDFDVLFFKSNLKRLFSPNVLPFSKSLFTYLRKKSYLFDVIISSDVFTFPALFASIICCEKLVVWHELALHPHKFHQIPSKFWYNVVVPIFMKNTFVIPRSRNAEQFIKKYLRCVSSETVDHGINVSKFNISKNKKRQFCIVSQLIPRKNISSILKKFSTFIQDSAYSDFKLMIIGKGVLEDDLKKRCIELTIQDNVRFLGFLKHDEMIPYLRDSMALLIDTKQDNNMVSIAESVVCGTPVLTNTIPTNSYVIKEKSLGISKEMWDKDDMKLIVDHSDFYINNCCVNRDSFSYEENAKKILNIFCEFIRNK